MTMTRMLNQRGRLQNGGAAKMAEMDWRIRLHAKRCLCMTPLPGGVRFQERRGAKPWRVIATGAKTASGGLRSRESSVRRVRNTRSRTPAATVVQ